MARKKAVTPAPKPEDTSQLRTLSNGAVYDMEKHRIVANPGGGTFAITSERASEFAQLRQERKRAALVRAANAVAQQGASVDGHVLDGDLAFVEAIGEAMTMKALTVNDPKAVDAARFIFAETGITETAAPDAPSVFRDVAAGVADAMMRILSDIMRVQSSIPEQIHETIEGEIKDV